MRANAGMGWLTAEQTNAKLMEASASQNSDLWCCVMYLQTENFVTLMDRADRWDLGQLCVFQRVRDVGKLDTKTATRTRNSSPQTQSSPPVCQ